MQLSHSSNQGIPSGFGGIGTFDNLSLGWIEIHPNLPVDQLEGYRGRWESGRSNKLVDHPSRSTDFWWYHHYPSLLGGIQQKVLKQTPRTLGGQDDQHGLEVDFLLDNFRLSQKMFSQSLQDRVHFDGHQLARHESSLYDHPGQPSIELFKKRTRL